MDARNEENIDHFDKEVRVSEVKDEDHERPEWSNRFQYILSLLGYSVGLGNLWRFPYVCQRNGGGIGYSMLVVNLLAIPYYSQILTWGLYYLYNSFSPVLPWTTCGNTWNTPHCVVARDTGNKTWYNVTSNNLQPATEPPSLSNETFGHSSTEEFWQYNTLSISSGLGDFGSIQPHLLLCWFLACLAVFLCLIKGVKSLGKVIYVTAIAPYVLLSVLLVKSCTMPGAIDGILFFLVPDFEKLKHVQVWLEAAIQLFMSLGPALGPLIVMASHNNNSQRNALTDTVIVCVCGELTSFFAGLVVFSTVGYLAHSLDLPVADVITSGPGIGFIVYPEAASVLPLPQLWSVLFFLALLMMGIDSVFAHFEMAVSCLEDLCSRRFSLRHFPTLLAGVITAYTFVVGLVFTTSGGIYVFQLMDWYTAAFVCLVISFLECVVVGWMYGINRFSVDVENMTGKRMPMVFKIVIVAIIPCILLVMIVMTLSSYKPPTYGDYTYPPYTETVGWLISFTSVLPIPIVMVVQILKQNGNIWKRLKKTAQPDERWQRVRRRFGHGGNHEHLSLNHNILSM